MEPAPSESDGACLGTRKQRRASSKGRHGGGFGHAGGARDGGGTGFSTTGCEQKPLLQVLDADDVAQSWVGSVASSRRSELVALFVVMPHVWCGFDQHEPDHHTRTLTSGHLF